MKSKSFKFFIIIFIFLFLVACGPSEQAIQEALAQTQAAEVTKTYTPEPTSTFTLEPSLTPTASQTLTPTATQTLTSTPDTRVITIDSKDLMLAKEDLPPEAKYFLPNSGWISPHHNSEIISGWGKEEGMIYLEETGRIDGWWVYYRRGTVTVRAPEEIGHNIVQYESKDGALLTVTKFSIAERNSDLTVVEESYDLGDKTIISMEKEMQPNGEYRIWYIIESSYRNYVSVIKAWGWEAEYDLDFVIGVAEIALEKIKSAPLGNW